MRKAVILLLILVMIVPLTGCWNRRELNEIAIAVGLAIDKIKKNEYRVSVQVVDPGEIAPKQGGGGRSPVVIYQTKADTVFEALRKMTTISPRKIYLSHLRILVLGKSVAKEGIAKSLEMLSRDHEVRSDFFVVLAQNVKAEDILKFISPIEKITAQKLFSSLEVSEQVWAPTYTVKLDELISSIVSDGKSSVLTGVEYIGNKETGASLKNVETVAPKARLRYGKLAVLRRDKLVGWLNEKESKGLNYILDNVKNTVGSIACPKGGNAVLEVNNVKSKIKSNVVKGKPKINIELSYEANVGEVRCDVDISKKEGISSLERSSEKTTEEILRASIKKAKKLKADIFGFGEEIHRTNPKAWKMLKKDWSKKGFVELPVTIHITAKIRRTGTTGSSFLTEAKE